MHAEEPLADESLHLSVGLLMQAQLGSLPATQLAIVHKPDSRFIRSTCSSPAAALAYAGTAVLRIRSRCITGAGHCCCLAEALHPILHARRGAVTAHRAEDALGQVTAVTDHALGCRCHKNIRNHQHQATHTSLQTMQREVHWRHLWCWQVSSSCSQSHVLPPHSPYHKFYQHTTSTAGYTGSFAVAATCAADTA